MNDCTIARIFEKLYLTYYYNEDKNLLMSNLNTIYHGIHKNYINKHSTLAYNIIVIPNLECLYETKFKTLFNVPENTSGTFRELRNYCREKQIFLVVVNITYCIITQNAEQRDLLQMVAQQSEHYKRFIIYLRELENNSNYKFNMLTWIDELNDEDKLNVFCSLSHDTFLNN